MVHKFTLFTALFLSLTFYLTGMAGVNDFGTTDMLHNGDLLFFAQASGGNAITQVTNGTDDLQIDHVAILYRSQQGDSVIEAIHKGVVLSSLDSVEARAHRNNERIIVGRITCDFDTLQSLRIAKTHLGKPYDFYFEPTDSAIYCSELVQLSYVTHHGNAIFNTIPMSFHTPDGKILPYWTEYYRRAGKNVPEGEPGTNPGQLSRSENISIIFTLTPKQQEDLH